MTIIQLPKLRNTSYYIIRLKVGKFSIKKTAAYLEFCHTTIMELFCEKIYFYFRKKPPTERFDWILNMRLKKMK